MKYSIIVPVYNAEKYLRVCLNSLINQTYHNYEIIIVNDGSTDNSLSILNEYAKKDKRIKVFNKKNTGPADTRNFGVNKSNGDYIIFVDSDDYVEPSLLAVINNAILSSQDLDILKYCYVYVENNSFTNFVDQTNLNQVSGEIALVELIKKKIPFDMPCIYAINRHFWVKYKFKFIKGKYHEDFGLIPLLIFKAEKVSSINFPLYYYVKREGSIMTTKNYESIVQKAYDMLFHYNNLKKFFVNANAKVSSKKFIYSYISNAVIFKARDLKKYDFEKYVQKLKEHKVFDDLISDTIGQKVKKILLKTVPNIIIKRMKGGVL